MPTGFDESKNNAVYEELKKRIEETNTMRVLCGNIKQWIKKHKTQLLKKSSENETAVIELQKQVSHLRRKISDDLSSGAAAGGDFEVQSVAASESSEMSSMHDDLARYQKQVNFNFENFANATENEILTMNLVSQNSIQEYDLADPMNAAAKTEDHKAASNFLHLKAMPTSGQEKYVLALN